MANSETVLMLSIGTLLGLMQDVRETGRRTWCERARFKSALMLRVFSMLGLGLRV